jgi:hypothetical protein
MSKVASSTLGYRTVIEVGIATVVGAAEKDDKGANWCDLLLNGSGRFGWFTKGAQVMGIRGNEEMESKCREDILIPRNSYVCWLVATPHLDASSRPDSCSLPRVHRRNAP